MKSLAGDHPSEGRGAESLDNGQESALQTVEGGANLKNPSEQSEKAQDCPRRPRLERQAPPCLRPADGQRAVLQLLSESAAPQRKAVFDPVDVRRRVSLDHTVQAEAAPHRFHQVGEGFSL